MTESLNSASVGMGEDQGMLPGRGDSYFKFSRLNRSYQANRRKKDEDIECREIAYTKVLRQVHGIDHVACNIFKYFRLD